MFGFPPILDGNASVKLTNNADSGFPKPGIREVFYSIKSGNWSDITIWQTTSGRVGLLPSTNDDVYIRHTVTGDTTATINNLFISGIFTINAAITLSLGGKFVGAGGSQLINKGGLALTTQVSAEQSYSLGILDITSFANTVYFNGNYSATIPSYFTAFSSLYISGTGIKTTAVNIVTSSALTIGANGNLTMGADLTAGAISMIGNIAAVLECSSYNLIVNGTTITGGNALNYISKNSNIGTITFIGAVTLGNSSTGFLFTGNPNVEFRGGLAGTNQNFGGAFPNTGTGQWKFSTVSQSFNWAGSCFANMNASILIDGPITLTMIGSSTIIGNTINGNNASSTLTLSGFTLVFNNVLYYLPMTTGVFNQTGGGIQYLFNGSITLPYTAYGALAIGGTGTKTLAGNTTMGSLTFPTGVFGTLECSTFDLTVSGITTVNRSGSFKKSGAGNIVFIGLLRCTSDLSQPTTINFSGNPNVELRAGMYFVNTGPDFITGTGTFTFTTASQSLDWNIAVTFNCNIVISGNITVTYVNTSTSGGNIIFNGTLNGTIANSTFRMGSNATPLSGTYRNTAQPMATGVLDTSTNLNTWIYGAGNQAVKGGSPQQYRNLRFSGSGTTKTLQGNINVQNTYTVDAGVTVDLNGFTKTP